MLKFSKISKQICYLFYTVMLFLAGNCFFAQENEFGTDNWLWQQRVYPFDTMPQNAYEIAIDYQLNNGFYLDAPAGWIDIGPSIFGSGSGRVACIKYDPNNSDIIYIAAHSGGVWKSTNSGTMRYSLVFVMLLAL